MYGRILLSLALALATTVTWAAPLRVDLSQNGDVEPGWFDWNTGGTRLNNTNVSKQFLDVADFDADFTIDFIKIDSRNRAQVDDAVPLHDVYDDAFKEGDPFDMVIKGLEAGVYTMTTHHHDPLEDVANDDGTLNITVKDADGARLVADHFQQSWGPNPAEPASTTFTVRSDGVSDIVLTFADNNDGVHNEAFLNGFEIDRAVEPTKASAPQPADGATDVPLDVVLHWTAAETAPAANGHKVYFSPSLDEVENGAPAAERAMVTPPVFDTQNLPFPLEYGTTYYWRIDEATGAGGWSTGQVWSFTTEPFAYPIPRAAITATASSWLSNDTTPDKTIDGSGLVGDLHSTELKDMWQSAPGGAQPTWLQYEFDKVYSLHEMWVWNSNQLIESFVGFGLKDVVVEYSTDGAAWTPLAENTEFARASGAPDYAHNTTVAFGGAAARFVRITAGSSWGGAGQYGLSEVRFYSVPVQAREPQPVSGAAAAGPDVILSWRPGRQAASHEVYLSTDPVAVQDGTAPMNGVSESSFDAGTLQLGTTYYWRVDEVNTAETPAAWQGELWNFTTPEFLVVDDFEDYGDNEGERIYETWVDGWDVADNGSQVGYGDAPFAEQTIINSGRQSMPLAYDNTTASFSEATRTFAPPQDWTHAGVKTLTLYFRGEPNNAAGKLYVKANNTQLNYEGDAGDLAKTRWIEWNIDLASMGGNFRSIRTLTLGVETTGAGRVYVDDIRLYPSRCVPSLSKPEGDLNDDCTVDYLDVQIMADDWLARDATLTTATAAQVATGLLAHYKLDGNVLDSSGNNLNGTINGDPVYTTAVLGQALTFDGTGDYVSCTNNVKFDAITDAMTAAAWIRVDAFDVTYQAIVTKGDTSWRISRNTETDNIHWRANGPAPDLRVNGQVNVNDGEWHHVAGTYDGAIARLYVDGMPDGSVATTGRIATNVQQVQIGGNAEQTTRLWKGAIDDVRIYGRALTEAEVRFLADPTPGDGELYVPIKSPAELYDAEPVNQRSVNLKDFSTLADGWLDTRLWP